MKKTLFAVILALVSLVACRRISRYVPVYTLPYVASFGTVVYGDSLPSIQTLIDSLSVRGIVFDQAVSSRRIDAFVYAWQGGALLTYDTCALSLVQWIETPTLPFVYSYIAETGCDMASLTEYLLLLEHDERARAYPMVCLGSSCVDESMSPQYLAYVPSGDGTGVFVFVDREESRQFGYVLAEKVIIQ
jgi:hypothetical protein